MIHWISASLLCLVAATATPSPISTLVVPNYLGHWFQVYTDAINEATFENSTYCATADYGVNANGTVSVLNKARIGSIDGNPYAIAGWAAPTENTTFEGELTVHLQGVDFPAPYWIYEVGPATFNGTQYEYSIVSDPGQWSLFVLARNVSDFNVRFRIQVLAYLQVNGWNQTWNAPIEVPQAGCTY